MKGKLLLIHHSSFIIRFISVETDSENASGAAKWDERYGRGEHATEEPSRLLVRAVELFAGRGTAKGVAPPRALDIACGAGRHAVFLAARGFDVTAVDSSRVGVGLTRERARAAGVVVDARVADLERGEFESSRVLTKSSATSITFSATSSRGCARG